MKKSLLIFALILTLCAACFAFTACGDENDDVENDNDDVENDNSSEGLGFALNYDGTCYVANIGTCTDTDIVIPSVSPKGRKVTGIGAEAFYNCTGITSVTIPDSVTIIGKDAFYGCYKLVEVINLSSLDITAGSSDYGYVGYYAKEVHKGESKIVNYNDYLFYTYNGGNYLLGYVGEDTALVLPESYNGENYEIYKYAFYERNDITSVTIGNSVTSIDSSVFSGCYKLVEVINLSSLDITAGSSDYGYVGYYAKEVHKGESKIVNYNDYLFYTYNGGNYLLGYVGEDTALVLPESYNGENYEIYKCAFYERKDITSVTIPDSVKSIGDYAFQYCTGLTSITVSEGNTAYKSIDGNLYSKDGKILIQYAIGKTDTSFVIPDSVKSIGWYAFYYCDSLKSVTIPDSVTSIGRAAFSGCTGLTSVTIGNSVTSIGNYAFEDCSSLTSVYITDIAAWCNISFGDYYANPLSYAGNLYLNGTLVTEIIIPDSVTSIGERAFEDCSSLTSVTIGNSVTSIGKDAFYGCYKLVEVINLSSLDITAGSSDYGKVGLYAIEVHKGESKIVNYNDYLFYTYNGLNYLFGYVGEDTALVLPESYKGENYEIYNYAFYERKDITSVTIPDSVTSIGDYAFYYCRSLTSVTIPNSVTSIGDSAFSGCTSLTCVTIPDSVTSIGWYAFEYCSSLTIYCEAASKPSGWDYYWNSSNCPVVWAHNNITSNSDYDYVVHNEKANLTKYKGTDTEIIIPSTIDGYAVVSFGEIFENNASITSVVIPNSVTSIGNNAFYECYSLTSVTIGNSVTSIGEEAFRGCTSLTRVTIPDSVTSIGEWAFCYCDSLTIYCEAASKPSGWSSDWNYSNRPVVWGYKG